MDEAEPGFELWERQDGTLDKGVTVMPDKVPTKRIQSEEIDPRKLGWLPRTDLPAPHGMETWEHPSGRLHLHNRRANGPFKLAVLRKIKPQDQQP